MTTTAKKLQSTPMAPYMGILMGMNVDDMHIVVEFLNETIREAEKSRRQTEDEFLAEKMAEIKISPRITKS